VAFEDESRLTHIEESFFSECSFPSIFIPRSVENLDI
jgi:hypothetical protein